MDYGFKFENLVIDYIGRPDYVTYATYWNNKNVRTSLLFTVCIKEYDKNSTGEIGGRLKYFMRELFNDSPDKKISIECLNYVSSINN